MANIGGNEEDYLALYIVSNLLVREGSSLESTENLLASTS